MPLKSVPAAALLTAFALGACSGGSTVPPVPTGATTMTQSVARSTEGAAAMPAYATAAPTYASAFGIYASAFGIYASPFGIAATRICDGVSAENGACSSYSASTTVLPAGTPAGSLPGFSPTLLQRLYALNSTTAGAGQTVGIVIAGDAPNAASDLAVYRSTYGLPACTTGSSSWWGGQRACFQRVDEQGGQWQFPAYSAQWAIEAAIDTDMVSAVCPNCKILLVEAHTSKVPDMMQAAKTAVALGATVISNSYAYLEDQSTRQQRREFSSPGVPFVAGTGDANGEVVWPASADWAIAVGGTTLVPAPNSARGIGEQVWANSGGGCSADAPQPAWQSTAKTNCSMRWTPDVTAFADPNPGVAVYVSPQGAQAGWRTYGGTSVATPIVAAAIALAGKPGGLQTGEPLYRNAADFFPVAGGALAGLGSPNGPNGFISTGFWREY